MKTESALVLSGGGMFGAWQAGAWRALAGKIQPGLVVGASVGSLNGYAIAGGATPEELIALWHNPAFAKFDNLPATIQELMSRYPLNPNFAIVLTDLLRMKPKVFRGSQITWRHLAASCALPGLLPFYKIDGRRYGDGGLLNPLPVWAAVELGARQVLALHVLPDIPSVWLKPAVTAFRWTFAHNPRLPADLDLTTLEPPAPLGSLHDALYWNRENIDRWIQQGDAAAKKHFHP